MILLLVSIGCGSETEEIGTDARHIFAAGNALYGEGDFEEAARHYRQLLNQGIRAEAVHYNLGNALFKLDQLGPAILQYEKAAVLAPGDSGIAENLSFLRALTADAGPGGGAQTTSFFVARLLRITTLDQDAVALSIFYLTIASLTGMLIQAASPRLRRLASWGIAAAGIPILLLGIAFGVKLYRAQTITHAVVLQDRVDVRSGPGDDNATLFTIHEGLKIRIRTDQGSWFQVSLDSGLNGWVPSSSIGKI